MQKFEPYLDGSGFPGKTHGLNLKGRKQTELTTDITSESAFVPEKTFITGETFSIRTVAKR